MAGRSGHRRLGSKAETYREARGLWLLLPVLGDCSGILTCSRPWVIMLVYSFLTKEFRGGVIWEFSPGGL